VLNSTMQIALRVKLNYMNDHYKKSLSFVSPDRTYM